MIRLTACLALLLTVGCIERIETIVIREDGSARLATVVRGDPGDVTGGDAVPSKETGWQVEDRTETDAEGRQTLIRSASQDLASGTPLPASYAADGSRAAQLGLSFPTTVQVEHADNGTYYHFRRVYPRRAWWAVEYLRHRAFETDEIKRLGAMDPKSLNEAERALLVDTLANYAADELGVFLDLAASQLSPPLEQRAYLNARRSARPIYHDKQLASRVVDLLTQDAPVDLAPLEQEVRTRAKDAIAVSLTDDGVSKEQIASFLEAYERVRETYELTKDLSDESWKVSVELPGTIVAHNAGEADSSATNQVEWKFDGKAMFDRDLVLMATSFVPKEAEKR